MCYSEYYTEFGPRVDVCFNTSLITYTSILYVMGIRQAKYFKAQEMWQPEKINNFTGKSTSTVSMKQPKKYTAERINGLILTELCQAGCL